MSSPTQPSGGENAAPGTITLAAIMAAKTAPALEKLAKVLSETIPSSVSGLDPKRAWLINKAMEKGLLHESQCAKVVQESPELQDKLLALQMEIQDARRVAAEAAANAEQALAGAAAAQEDNAILRAQVKELAVAVHGMTQRQEEAADAAEQQRIETQAIWFNHTLEDGELAQGQGGEGLCGAVRAALRKEGVSEEAVSSVTEVFVLPARGADKRAPVVLRCTSLQSKLTLLRAARGAGTPDRGLQMAARLTKWQQARKKALLPQLQQLKADGATVRFFRGHILQKKVGVSWVEVPLAHTA